MNLPQTKPPAAFLIDRPVFFYDLMDLLGTLGRPLARSTLYRWIESGDLPKPRKLGKTNFWPAREIYTWATEKGLVVQWPDAANDADNPS